MLSDAYLKRYADSDPNDVLENVRCPEEGVHNMLELSAAGGGHSRLSADDRAADEMRSSGCAAGCGTEAG